MAGGLCLAQELENDLSPPQASSFNLFMALGCILCLTHPFDTAAFFWHSWVGLFSLAHSFAMSI